MFSKLMRFARGRRIRQEQRDDSWTYDMWICPASYNVVEALAIAQALGFTHTRFNNSGGVQPKFPGNITKERIRNILEPACGLFGMTHDFGPQNGPMVLYTYGAAQQAWEQTKRMGKARSVLPPGNARYTVTMRDYPRWEFRNSSREAWQRFAQAIGAEFIDDWYIKPIGLHERMALYAGAEMNYFVNSGPGALCVYSDYPYTMFIKADVERSAYEQMGLASGQSPPWANSRQRWVWDDDTYDNLMRAHERALA